MLMQKITHEYFMHRMHMKIDDGYCILYDCMGYNEDLSSHKFYQIAYRGDYFRFFRLVPYFRSYTKCIYSSYIRNLEHFLPIR